MRRFLQWLFPPTFWAQVMVGVFFVITFTIPAVLGAWIWPQTGQSDVWKIAAIMVGASVFVGLKATYSYFVMLLANREQDLREAQDR